MVILSAERGQSKNGLGLRANDPYCETYDWSYLYYSTEADILSGFFEVAWPMSGEEAMRTAPMAEGPAFFSAVRDALGYSHQDVADAFGVRLDTAKSWSSGRRRPPPPILDQARAALLTQERAAVDLARAHRGAPQDVFLSLMITSDVDARAAGYPRAEIFNRMIARAWAICATVE